MAQADSTAGASLDEEVLKRARKKSSSFSDLSFLEDTSDLMFNPAADISGGRVNEINVHAGPRPTAVPTGERQTSPIIEEKVNPVMQMVEAAARFAPKVEKSKATDATQTNPRSYGDQIGEPMRRQREEFTDRNARRNRVYGDQVGEKMRHPDFLKGVADELGMKAGALTTVDLEESIDPETRARVGNVMGTRRLPEPKEPEPPANELASVRDDLESKLTPYESMPGARTSVPPNRITDNEVLQAWREQQVEEDAAAAEDQKGMMQRAGAKMGSGLGHAKTLTRDDYNDLTPRQRAAVDLNSMLASAVRQDSELKRRGKKQGGAEYDATVKEVYGEDAPEMRYAPATMNLLDTLNVDLSSTDLDRMLNLKIGFTADELARLGDKTAPSINEDLLLTPASERRELQTTLLDALMQTRRDPQHGAALLGAQHSLLGAQQKYDFGGEANNQWAENAYNGIISAENDEVRSQRMAEVKQAMDAVGPEYWKKFLGFLDTRIREAQQYKNPLGSDPEADYPKARVLRRKLDL